MNTTPLRSIGPTEHASWDSATRTAIYYGSYVRDGAIRIARITNVHGRETGSVETGAAFPDTKAGARAMNAYLTEINCRRVVRA